MNFAPEIAMSILYAFLAGIAARGSWKSFHQGFYIFALSELAIGIAAQGFSLHLWSLA